MLLLEAHCCKPGLAALYKEQLMPIPTHPFCKLMAGEAVKVVLINFENHFSWKVDVEYINIVEVSFKVSVGNNTTVISHVKVLWIPMENQS